MKIIGIDPSLNHIGLAWFDTEKDIRVNTLEVEPPFNPDPVARRIFAAQRLFVKIQTVGFENADVAIIEYPNFQTSERGKIAAQEGHTFDLAFIAGAISGRMRTTRWFMPTPVQWKGNRSKEAMGVRFTEWTGLDYHKISDHRYEAAMMIKWFLDKN